MWESDAEGLIGVWEKMHQTGGEEDAGGKGVSISEETRVCLETKGAYEEHGRQGAQESGEEDGEDGHERYGQGDDVRRCHGYAFVRWGDGSTSVGCRGNGREPVVTLAKCTGKWLA